MLFGKKKSTQIMDEFALEDEFLDEDDFFMAEEIEGYDCCDGFARQKCMREDCSVVLMLPTISTLN